MIYFLTDVSYNVGTEISINSPNGLIKNNYSSIVKITQNLSFYLIRVKLDSLFPLTNFKISLYYI